MSYNISLAKISTHEYKSLLKKQNLLPGRQILWQNIDANFTAIEEQGIGHLDDLSKAIANPKKIEAFAKASGIPAEYLNILRREMGSLVQKPVKIEEFPGISQAVVLELNQQGVLTSKDVYDSQEKLDAELVCLCNLTRINGVGAIAARLFFDAGYCQVKDVAEGNAADMQKQLNQLNQEKNIYKASLGEKDMQFCIDAAALLLKYE